MTGSPSDGWNHWRQQLNPTDYDERWRRIEASGANPHGEADLVFSYGPRSVLDGGCGTGRVAIELAHRGLDVVGADLDPDMIGLARAKAPELIWVHADLSELDLPTRFDAVVLAGNVIPYVASDRRVAAVAACARHLTPGGRLVAGFQLQAGWPSLTDYDRWCDSAGLSLEARYATWDRGDARGSQYDVDPRPGRNIGGWQLRKRDETGEAAFRQCVPVPAHLLILAEFARPN